MAAASALRGSRVVGRRPRAGRAAARARTAPRAGLGTTLPVWLLQQEMKGTADADLAILLNSIASACKRISQLVSSAPLAGNTGASGTENASGDEVKKLDIIANDVFCSCVQESGRTGIVVTEEEEVPVAVDCTAGEYIATFDPIDGSSNIDACVTTGSIFGIYSKGECEIRDSDSPEDVLEACLTNVRQSGDELRAAGYCMYSSSTVLVLSVGNGVYGFTLDKDIGEFVMSHDNLKVPDEDGQRIFSGNLGNMQWWDPTLVGYVDTLTDPEKAGGKPYSYRYIGALVGDFHRTLLYGGIWLYPVDAKAPKGKARLLYEVAPMGFLMEQAGGMATFGPTAGERVLEVVPESTHAKHPMFCGSKREVTRLQKYLETVAA